MARIISIYRGAGQFTEVDMDRDPILVERETTHGDFGRVAKTAQAIKAIYSQGDAFIDVRQTEALDLIATKIARILNGNAKEKDHWLDIAGYAKLGAEACE